MHRKEAEKLTQNKQKQHLKMQKFIRVSRHIIRTNRVIIRMGTQLHIAGQVTHPDIVKVDGGWNGYEYWMVYTPNVSVTSQYENPYIAASNDGENWIEPEGIKNPIEPEPISTRFHNCDVDMVYNKKMNAMMAYWNWADDNGDQGAEVRMRVSYDGIHWGSSGYL